MEYESLLDSIRALLSEEDAPLTTLANAAAWLYDVLPDINWSGFYLFDGTKLVLGPFCGKPACTVIRPDRGVCGAAFSSSASVLVPDVHLFPGHIACDSASRSEIVIPLRKSGTAFGVLDIDSPLLSRFTDDDRRFLEAAAAVIESALGNDPLCLIPIHEQ